MYSNKNQNGYLCVLQVSYQVLSYGQWFNNRFVDYLVKYFQDLHLNRVVVKESAPNSPEPADPHHRHPKQAKVKSYDLSVMDKFWGLHKGRCVILGWEK